MASWPSILFVFYSGLLERDRSSMADVHIPLIKLVDLVLCAFLIFFLPLAWLIPERYWYRVAKRILWLGSHWRLNSALVRQKRIARALEFRNFSTLSARELDREIGINWIVRQFQILRSYRPGGWNPDLSLIGKEYLDTALSQGKGAILWCSTFAFDPIVTKMALHRNGYELTHLSVRSHGYSDSAFGICILNPIMVSIENRFLRHRAVINREPNQAINELRAAVRQNSVITIVAVKGASRRPAIVQFLGCELPIGMGAPNIAYDEGAILLPVFTFREPNDKYVVHIDPEIPLNRALPRSEAAYKAMKDYAIRLEKRVFMYPEQWRAWDTLTL